jgi:hypothetical protein
VTLAWPPVLAAIQTGNVTLFMALAAALVWRFRDSQRGAAASLGVSLAAKLYLWPLAVWLVVTRRTRTALWALVVAIAVLTVTWAAIGFAGLTGYPSLLHHLADNSDKWGFSLYAVGLDAGASSPVARAIWLAFAIALLCCVVLVGRAGDERRAFVLALAACIAFSPIVWLHYFALLVVVVAVGSQTLGLAWFAPLLMWITMDGQAVPAIGNGAPAQTVSTLGVAALTVALACSERVERALRRYGLRDAATAE